MSALRSSSQPAVFVIAPTDVSVHIRATDNLILRFANSAEFEQWRHQSSARIATAVYAALDELKLDPARCSPRTQEVLARLCERETIPSVKEMVAACSSRRSFYRSWSDDVRQTPGAFLTRVRLLHLLHATVARAETAQGGTSADSHTVQ